MTNEEIIREELERIKQDLIKKHIELGMKASGKWEESLRIEITEVKGILSGLDYTYQLQHGRKAGTMPPIRAIEEWIISKGIKPISDNIKISSLAFLIARKIQKEGTRYFKQGGTDLIDSVITPERMQHIMNRISTLYVTTFTSDIINLMKDFKNE